MWVGSHASLAFGRELCDLTEELSTIVKKFFRLVAPQPFFQQPQVLGIFSGLRQWNLVRTKRSIDWLAIDELRSGPAFRRAQHNHRPLRAFNLSIRLNRVDLIEDGVESCGHQL